MQAQAHHPVAFPQPGDSATDHEMINSTTNTSIAAAPCSPAPFIDLDDAVVHDPILDLCPSLDILQQLVRSPRFSRQTKKHKLTRALLRAASNGDTDMLSWLLDSRADARALLAEDPSRRDSHGRIRINFGSIRDEDGTGPVVLASCAGHIDAATILIMNGADVDERDACGWTPLMWATNSSNLPLASFLLSRGADVEAKSNKGTKCEDFILSAAPDAAMSLDPAKLNATAPARHAATDREAIADLIYEHQRSLSVQQSAFHRLNSLNLHSPVKERPAIPFTFDTSISTASSSPPPVRARKSSHGGSTSPFKQGHTRSDSQLTSRRLVGRYERAQLVEQQLKQKEVNDARKSALSDMAILLEVDYDTLVGELPTAESDETTLSSATVARRRRATFKHLHADIPSGCGAAEVGSDVLSEEFDWKVVRHDQMLVFGHSDLDPLLNMIITNYIPTRAPWVSRAAPANILFLCARYACSLGDEDLLEELFLSAIDRIEGVIYSHPTEMTYLAFWLSNCCLLHYYTEKDRTLKKSSSVAEYRALLTDLLNEIYVFIIRDAERRIDKVLDSAMLDHEPIQGFQETRFEGEWKFMKSLAGSVKGLGQQGMSSSSSSRLPISQIFGGSRREDNRSGESMTPSASAIGNGRPNFASGASTIGASVFRQGGDASPRKLGESPHGLREVSYIASASDLLTKPTPRTITSLLTSTLQILQFYEINPAIIVQGFSQIFFWVGCELFNRVLTRKRYLCRSKAIQIRMNISALEDWARSNALPLSIVHSHLSPLTQLISWLQCQSSLQEFDGLIATMQGLKALTPIQLRKAVKDYRYEVGEARMSEECVQYLDQLILDWKRRQDDQLRQVREEARSVQKRKKMMKKQSSSHHRSGTATQQGYTPDSRSPSPEGSDDEGEEEMNVDGNLVTEKKADTSVVSTDTAKVRSSGEPLSVAEAAAKGAQQMIDSLFLPGKSIADYVPPWTAAGPPLGLHEDGAAGSSGSAPSSPVKSDALLNSRDMLPFAIPKKRNTLIVTPGDAFGFGRGHFTGTGSPSLRSVSNGGSEAASAASSRRSSLVGGGGGGGVSRPDSPNSASQAGIGLASGTSTLPDDEDMDTASRSSSRTDLSAASHASSLFPQGQGFAAGAYWSPVPLLPEGMLAKIDTLMRNVASFMPGDNSRNVLLAESVSGPKDALKYEIPARETSHLHPHLTPAAMENNGQGPTSYFPDQSQIDSMMGQTKASTNGFGGSSSKDPSKLPPSSRIVIPPRDRSMLQSSSPQTATAIQKSGIGGPDGSDGLNYDDDVKTPGPHRQSTLKAQPF